MAISNKYLGSVNSEFDTSLKERQNCVASSGSSIEIIESIAVSTTVEVSGVEVTLTGECPSDIIYFNSDTDGFTLESRPEGNISTNREDVEGTTGYLGSTAGQLSQTRSYTLKGEYSSTLIQMFEKIIVMDSVNGYNGELIKAYSNGGYHLRTIKRDKSKDTEIIKYSMNVKLEDHPDTFSGFDSDSTVELSFRIEYSPVFELRGDLSAFGIPEGIINSSLEASYDEADRSVTVTPTVTKDTNIKISDTNVEVQIFDTGASILPIATQTIPIGSPTIVALPQEVVGDIYIRMFLLTDPEAHMLTGCDLTITK